MSNEYPPPHPAPQQPTPQRPAPVPQIVHIRAKSGGVASALAFIAVLLMFGVAFIFGIVLGVGAMIAGSAVDAVVMEHTYREAAARSRDKIAILPIEGVIDEAQALFVRAAVDHILDDSQIKAVILRVDSPGGGVTASDQIWYEVERLKQNNLPVIASYGGLAASGGYYVSCGADHIFAQETTITGSIGVIAQMMTLHNLMDKIGVQPITLVATGSPEKDFASPFREWTEHDRQKILVILDHAYDIFTQRVAQGRSATLADRTRLEAAATGGVFTADEAVKLGLIDSIGYLDDAIAHAETAARLAAGRAHVVRIESPPSIMQAVFGAKGSVALPSSGVDAESMRTFVNELSVPRFMYLMW